MNAPLTCDQTALFAGNVAGADGDPTTTAAPRGRSGSWKRPGFVERRRTDAVTSYRLIRSPAVLGFVGLLGGLVMSAVLIIGVSVALALTGVSWMVAGQYCIAIILLVFGLVGGLLVWGTRTGRPYMAEMQRYLESTVERRRHYLYLSSINALENARRLGLWERRI